MTTVCFHLFKSFTPEGDFVTVSCDDCGATVQRKRCEHVKTSNDERCKKVLRAHSDSPYCELHGHPGYHECAGGCGRRVHRQTLSALPCGAAIVGRPTNVRWGKAMALDPALSSKAKAVGTVCALLYADYDTLENIRPGTPNLARDTGLSERGVNRGLRELIEHDYLIKVRRGHSGRATLYRGRFPKRASEDEATPVVEPEPEPCASCGRDVEHVGARYCWSCITGRSKP